jgi:hypothetical protein
MLRIAIWHAIRHFAWHLLDSLPGTLSGAWPFAWHLSSTLSAFLCGCLAQRLWALASGLCLRLKHQPPSVCLKFLNCLGCSVTWGGPLPKCCLISKVLRSTQAQCKLGLWPQALVCASNNNPSVSPKFFNCWAVLTLGWGPHPKCCLISLIPWARDSPQMSTQLNEARKQTCAHTPKQETGPDSTVLFGPS